MRGQRSEIGTKEPSAVPVWVMLATLSAVAAMSQAFRTVATVVAGDLQAEFGATAQELGLFAGAFHLAFAATQVAIGVTLDVYGVRRTVAGAFVLAIAGVLVSAFAPSLPVLIAGQLLVGIGCAPAFLGALVFVANRYPPEQFSRLSGLVLSASGIGMLATGTPLAWVVATWSWRAGFLVLAACAGFVLLAVVLLVSDDEGRHGQPRETLVGALVKIGPILAQRHTLGILVLGLVTYASFITLRGLWAVPMLVERHGYTLVQSGHVVLAASVATLLGPPAFGLIDVGPRPRRFLIVGCTLAYAAAFVMLAVSSHALVDVGLVVLLGFLTGYFVLQYADVRAAYSGEVAGRAFAVFNTAVFLGVAVMQWLTGLVVSASAAEGADSLMLAFLTIAALLVAATLAFVLLPWPRGARKNVAVFREDPSERAA
ncbi:MAG TPA: MFS transporter [Xanthobacteraceae bacterium]|nr:MFS transporter [Xanthobacteraceae bacterium]